MRDACDDRQSEPCAWHGSGGGCPVEAFEDVREVVIGDAWAVIGDRYLAVLDNNAHHGVGRRPLDGVADQVAYGVIDRGRVDVHQAWMQFGGDGQVWRALPEAGYRLIGEQVQAHGLTVRRGLVVAGEVEQVSDQLVQLAGLIPSRSHEGGGLRVRQPVAVFEQVQVRGEAGQRGAQLVRCVGDELALRGQ
jgi:hypothetical protein